MGTFQILVFLEYFIQLPEFNDPKTFIVNGRWAYEVGGKTKFNIWTLDEVEMSGQNCTYNYHLHKKKERKKKLFLLFQGMLLRPNTWHNPANSTFKTGKTRLFIAWADSKT